MCFGSGHSASNKYRWTKELRLEEIVSEEVLELRYRLEEVMALFARYREDETAVTTNMISIYYRRRDM